MSLRLKLFLIFGGLIAVLVLAQWLLIRSLTGRIETEIGEMAVTVGQGFAQVFVLSDDDTPITLGGDSDASLTYHTITKETTDHGVQVTRRKQIRKTLSKEEAQGAIAGEITALLETTSDLSHDEEVTHENGVQTYSKTYVWNNKDADQENNQWTHEVVGGKDTVLHEFKGSGRVDVKLDGPKNSEVHIFEDNHRVGLVPVPHAGVEKELTRLSSYMLGGSAIILLFGLLGGGYIAHRVSKPLAELSAAAKEVGEGALGKTVPDSGGYPEIRQAVASFNGMSVRLKELDELASQARRRQYLSELGEIARGLAHTIRNPLNTLGLSIEQMASLSARPDESRTLLEGSQKQIRRIDQWIRSFLALASEGRGQVELLDVGGLVQDVVLEVIQDNTNKARLDVSVEPGLPDIRAVPPELRAVAQALIVNAVEASPPGGQVNIRVGHGPGDGLRIEICDEGAGVPQEVRNRLFTPHVTTKTYGSGMGLFLAHRLATARYRGSLHLEDLQPTGTKAILELPGENEYDEYQNSGH